ncbi:hypothetical protein IIE18_10940 [Pseudomonas sp. V1]|uniref:hypothetical protein n=1 Tax=Pseudomonas arcuscaelestis TaxID=2710591 RepID=UPI00193FB363|nr:hypothetical protein [Pseudomonas arcuscaelestis]MBM3105655.1 hypothetical protein [Pseudomonas arcuscaelestis]
MHQPLPQPGADVQALAHQVSAAVLADQESLPGLCEIRTVELVLPPYADGSPWNASAVGGLVEASTDQLVSRLTVRGNEDRGFLCASITSTMEDRALDRLEATIKKAVRKQLTATRPGCVAVCLEGIDGQHLAELAKISTNPLRTLALDVFAAESSKHLACLAFVSLSKLTPRSERAWAGRFARARLKPG